jgi:hypothetical protein
VKDPEDRHPKMFQGRASYALTKEEKITFFECLNSIKVPTGFSSNIKEIINMVEKCQDYHRFKKISQVRQLVCHHLFQQ